LEILYHLKNIALCYKLNSVVFHKINSYLRQWLRNVIKHSFPNFGAHILSQMKPNLNCTKTVYKTLNSKEQPTDNHWSRKN